MHLQKKCYTTFDRELKLINNTFSQEHHVSNVRRKGHIGYFLSKVSFSYFLNVHYTPINLWKFEYNSFWNNLSFLCETLAKC